MIESEQQYRVTQERERAFSQLVERMENGTAQSTLDEDRAIRRAKMDATRNILQELREELQAWESKRRPDAGEARQTA